MGDRELLEAAARAAGIEVWRGNMPHQRDMLFRSCASVDGKVTGVEWNPLTDDGDALRLAVKMGIAVFPPETQDDDPTAHVDSAGDSHWITEERGADPYAATRRAIVRAAAEVGQGIAQKVIGDLPEDDYYAEQAAAASLAAAEGKG